MVWRYGQTDTVGLSRLCVCRHCWRRGPAPRPGEETGELRTRGKSSQLAEE